MLCARRFATHIVIQLLIAGALFAGAYHHIAIAADAGEESEVSTGHATRWKVSGYIQGRLVDEGRDEPLEFIVRRARLKVDASFTEEASFTLQLAADKHKISLKDAVVKYRLGNGVTLEFGQRKWNASYEVLQSSSLREMPERSTVVHYMFPGERDRGVMIHGTTKDGLYWSVGLWNGNGIKDRDGELNDFKDIIVYLSNLPKGKAPYRGEPRLNWQLYGYYGRKGQLILDGQGNEIGRRNRTKWRAGFGLQYHYANVPKGNRYQWREGSAIKLEAIVGRGYATDPSHQGRTWRNVSAWGFWVQWMQNLSDVDDLVIRYDLFDPDGGAHERAIGIGWVHYLGAVARFVATYELVNQQGRDDRRVTIQLQFKY